MDNEDADAAPLLEGTGAEVSYCDSIDFLDAREGNVRLLAWRWHRLGGEMVRMPVTEIVAPEAAALIFLARLARAITTAKERPAKEVPRGLHRGH